MGVFGSTVTEIFLNLTEVFLTLTEVFPCFFLSCKANARVELAKTGHGPHSSTLVCIYVVQLLLFMLFRYLCCSMYCLCVNVYCHRVTTQLQLINISYHIIYTRHQGVASPKRLRQLWTESLLVSSLCDPLGSLKPKRTVSPTVNVIWTRYS